MVKTDVLALGAYRTNCYIVRAEGSESCAVIDPGSDAPRILACTARLGLKIDAILLTHGHFDHVGAVRPLVEQTGCSLWMHQSDDTQPSGRESDFFYPLHGCDFTEVQFCEEGQIIRAGGLEFTVLETPGHTWGSVCYLCGDDLFSGDTLFAGSCGRTDLPGGDWATIHESLRRLKQLPGQIRVWPGHGGGSTMAEEAAHNPYLY